MPCCWPPTDEGGHVVEPAGRCGGLGERLQPGRGSTAVPLGVGRPGRRGPALRSRVADDRPCTPGWRCRPRRRELDDAGADHSVGSTRVDRAGSRHLICCPARRNRRVGCGGRGGGVRRAASPRPCSWAVGTRPADQATVRRSNLGLVLRHLRDAGSMSRARIAQETGLNKATVSSLVAELIDRGLVTAGDVDRAGSVGRPGPDRAPRRRHASAASASSSTSTTPRRWSSTCAARCCSSTGSRSTSRPSGRDRTLDAVAGLVAEAVAAAHARGAIPVGVTVALPGLVRSVDGVVDLRAQHRLARRRRCSSGCAPGSTSTVPSGSRTTRTCRRSPSGSMGSEARTADLVYLTGEVGVGGGVIVAGQLLRGSSGLSGEVGHTALGDPAAVCGCGRRGCWETVVGLAALLRDAADPDDPVRDPARDLETGWPRSPQRADAGDAAHPGRAATRSAPGWAPAPPS